MATPQLELRYLHGDWGSEAEHTEDEDVFFTEEAYEMFSLSRIRDIKPHTHENCQHFNEFRERDEMTEKTKEKPLKEKPPKGKKKQQKSEETSAKGGKQPSQKKTGFSLASPYPKLEYPTFSRLTAEQHRKFLELQAMYGSQGARVTTSRQSAERQHWQQLGGQIYKDQQDFISFAEYAANQYPKRYLSIPTAATKYIQDALRANLKRVESLPRHYTVLQTLTLDPGVPTPSDPTLMRIGSPVYLGKMPELSVPGLEDGKKLLKRTPVVDDPSPKKAEDVHEGNLQKLAEMHKADIILSSSSLLALMNNHAPTYEQQWEIPIEVRVNPGPSAPHRVITMRKPLMKQVYYPHEASALYHKHLVKRMLISASKDKFFRTATELAEDDQLLQDEYADVDAQMAEEDEFGTVSISDLETFGTELAVARKEEPCRDEAMDVGDDELEGSEKEKKRCDEKRTDGEELSPPGKVNPDQMEGQTSECAQLEDALADSSHGSSERNDSDHIEEVTNLDPVDEEEVCQSESLPTQGLEVKDSELMNAEVKSSEDKDNEVKSLEVKGSEMVAKSQLKLNLVKLHVRSCNVDKEELERIEENCAAAMKMGEKKTTGSVDTVTESVEDKAASRSATRKGMMQRMRFSSGSDSDCEKLMIITDSDIEDTVEHPKSFKVNQNKGCSDDVKSKGKVESNVQRILEQVEEEGHIVGECSAKEDEVAQSKTESESLVAKEVQELEGSFEPPENEEAKTKENTATRMVTRRSARIRKQSSCEEKTDNEQTEVAPKKKLTRKRRAKQSESLEKDSLAQTDEKASKIATESASIDAKVSKKLDNDVGLSASKPKADVSPPSSVIKNGKGQTKMETKELPSSEAALGFPTKSGVGNLVKDAKGHENEQGLEKGAVKGSSIGDQVMMGPLKRPAARRQVKMKISADKAGGTPSKQDKIQSAGARKLGKTESTIDEIMRLQEKMLTRQKSVTVSTTNQPHQGQGQSLGHAPGFGQESQPTIPEGLQHQGCDLRQPSEGSCAYSLWKFGRLRLLIQNKNHGLLREGRDAQSLVSVVAKMEAQSELGYGIQTPSDLTRLWLDMYLRPGSKVMRGRIDSRTSEILSWECLDMSNIMQSQMFRPGMCMKMLYHVLVKVSALSEGQYLLRHRPGDAHVCIYQCMGQAARNVRASYDLHAAHQACKLMTSLPPTIPWLPLDPNVQYPSSMWKERMPLTFPPCPPNHKHPSTQQRGGKHNKKKKKKKK